MLDTGTVGENALVWQVEATFTSAAKVWNWIQWVFAQVSMTKQPLDENLCLLPSGLLCWRLAGDFLNVS